MKQSIIVIGENEFRVFRNEEGNPIKILSINAKIEGFKLFQFFEELEKAKNNNLLKIKYIQGYYISDNTKQLRKIYTEICLINDNYKEKLINYLVAKYNPRHINLVINSNNIFIEFIIEDLIKYCISNETAWITNLRKEI